jgi:hypothetical protein
MMTITRQTNRTTTLRMLTQRLVAARRGCEGTSPLKQGCARSSGRLQVALNAAVHSIRSLGLRDEEVHL